MITNNFSFATNGKAMKNFSNSNQANGHSNVICTITANVFYTNQSAGQYVDVGYGDTAETASDYVLADSNCYGGTNVGALTWISTAKISDTPYVAGAISVYSNDTANNITVKEIGLVGKSNYSANAPLINILLARKVLDTPVVIPPGGVCAFKFGLKF